MRQRKAFTLVEMMVVIALTLFIMVILTQAFSAGLDVFRELKSIGDLQEELRGASTLLRTDLGADHFEAKRRLSEGSGPGSNIWMPRPREGFFRVYQTAMPSPPAPAQGGPYYSVVEGPSQGPYCYRSWTHLLHFTVKLRGNSRESAFSATVPAGSPLLPAQTTFLNQPPDARFQETSAAGATQTFTSSWAEVAYYLVKTGTTTEPSNPNSTAGTPIFALCRVQYALVPDNSRVNTTKTVAFGQQTNTNYPGISFKRVAVNGNMYFNSPSDLIYLKKAGNVETTNRRFDPTNPPGLGKPGVTLVLSNVVSFTVRTLQSPDFGSATRAPAVSGTTTDFADVQFDTGFDNTKTLPTAAPGGLFAIRALEITIRVWEQKTGQTQQIGIIQDM